jgi:HSP20 family protein
MKYKPLGLDWQSIQAKAEVLGNDFWQNLMGMIPNFGPRVDAYETKRRIVVVVEAPGIKRPDQLKVQLVNNRLVVEGKLDFYEGIVEKDLIIKERYHGGFKREIPLPCAVDPNSLRARYNRGLLTVKIEKLSHPEMEVQVEYADENSFGI